MSEHASKEEAAPYVFVYRVHRGRRWAVGIGHLTGTAFVFDTKREAERFLAHIERDLIDARESLR